MKPGSSRQATTHIQIVDKQAQDNMKGERKTLHILQAGAGKDKENLVGIGRTVSINKESLKPERETSVEKSNAVNEATNVKVVGNARKKQKKQPHGGKAKPMVTSEDLTSNEAPSEDYWALLAEKRRLALDEALGENMRLHEKIALLEEENATQKIMLLETTGVLEMLREMVGDVSDVSMTSTDSDETGSKDASLVE